MIVCHCNVIKRAEVESAMRRLLAEDPSAPLEPQYIYKELQKRGRCCSCFPIVREIVEKLLIDAMKEIDGIPSASASRLRTLLPKDA